MNKISIPNDWNSLLEDEINKPYFIRLMDYLNSEYGNYAVYPKFENIFNALKYTGYHDVKVVIIGQDPYHQINQSHGICFSVPVGEKIPPSLRSIFKELTDDVNITFPKHGNLISWAKQGVLLLNNVLTVRDSMPGSHRNKGWEIFTNRLIELINLKKQTVVYLLWGNEAKNKQKFITNEAHAVLTAVHPSPLSANRGFFGCKHFSKTNEILIRNSLLPINWQI